MKTIENLALRLCFIGLNLWAIVLQIHNLNFHRIPFHLGGIAREIGIASRN